MRHNPLKTEILALGGGEDLVTPALQVPMGSAVFAQNFDPGVNGGFDRVEGYERFDGRTAPSSTTAFAVVFTEGQIEPTIGTKVVGSISGASGVVTAVNLTGGSWAANDAAGNFEVSTVSGTFQAGEALQSENHGADDGFSTGFSGGFD